MTAGFWRTVADVLSAVFLIGGSALAFAAGVGVLRFRSLLSRTHAAAKPQSLGLALVLAGLALRLRDPSASAALLLVVVFTFMTAPVSAHLLARSGYRTGKTDPSDLVVDELGEAIAAEAAVRPTAVRPTAATSDEPPAARAPEPTPPAQP